MATRSDKGSDPVRSPARGAGVPVAAPRRMAALLLQLAMVGVLAFWIVILMVRPTRPWTKFNTQVTTPLTSPVYGNSASWLLMFSGPVFVFMLLAALYLQTASTKTPKPLVTNKPRASVWTYPVFTRGPLGIVSVGELLGLLLFVAILTFILASYLEVGFSRITPKQLKNRHLWQVRLDTAGVRLGLLGYVAMAFLFFPVARGSVLLRLINIPFEHAVKYHKWIAVIMMAIFTAHGAAFVVVWRSEHVLKHEITMWNKTGVNNLAGVIAFLSGVLICITSLPQVRSRFFEAFFFTHQLYIVFVVFAMMHTSERHFAVVMAGVFLYAIDRFLRFMQSRKSVDLLAVRNLPGGTMELVFPKHPGVDYTAASFIFVQLPGLARLQWHPFTLSSSALSEPDRISILVKRQGAWTQELERTVDQAVERASSSSQKGAVCPFGFKASIEGPYGHESSYFLKYDAIMFVAGGSGIAPFVSILKDLLHRYYQNSKEQQDLPTDVLLVWAVKTSQELHVLDTVSLPPGLEKSGLKLHMLAYVTREEAPDVEDMETLALQDSPLVYNSKPMLSPVFPEVGRDSNLGSVLVMVASLVGFLFVWGLLGYYYIDHDDKKHPYPSWAKGLFSLFSMLLGITFFGGITALFWSVWIHSRGYSQTRSKHHIVQTEMGYYPSGDMKAVQSPDAGHHEKVLKHHDIHYGARPNLPEIFGDASKRFAGCNVGVLVCGPEGMQQSVAQQCQANSSLFGGSVAFHFHSVSFQL